MPKDSVVDNNALALHDILMASMPQDAVHPESCVACSRPRGGNVPGETEKMYTQAELEEIASPLLQEVVRLKAEAQTAEAAGAVEAIKAEYEAQIEALQNQLDDAVLAQQVAVDELTATKAEQEAIVQAAEEKTAMEAVLDERVAKVREVASFTDEYIVANAERWAKLSDEAFTARLEEWAALVKESPNAIPKKTALSAARETGATRPASSTTKARALFQEVVAGESRMLTGGKGFDPRSIH